MFNKEMTMETLKIDGKEYVVLAKKEFSPWTGVKRTEIGLRLPKGKKFYYVTKYENGSYSSVVGPF